MGRTAPVAKGPKTRIARTKKRIPFSHQLSRRSRVMKQIKSQQADRVPNEVFSRGDPCGVDYWKREDEQSRSPSKGLSLFAAELPEDIAMSASSPHAPAFLERTVSNT